MTSTLDVRARGALAAALLACAAPLGAGCTSASSPPPPPAATPGQLALSVASIEAPEDAGKVTVTVTRTGGTDGTVTASLATADATAAAAADYASVSTTVTFQDGDGAAKSVDVAIVNDAAVEPQETFTITLSSPTGGASLGTSTTTVTILDDDAPMVNSGKVNDTGVTGCATGTGAGLACGGATTDFPRQDAQSGRDLTANADVDGRAGFSFTKLDAAGAALADQAAAYATTPWSCVLDRVTGLTWELRPAGGGLRDRAHTYSWFSSTGVEDGGDPGTPNAGACVDTSHCDTEKYREAVNAAGLCGHADWRLPSPAELLGIADLGAAQAPYVDAGWFPDTLSAPYWTAGATGGGAALSVDFATGAEVEASKRSAFAVRLVRGGMLR